MVCPTTHDLTKGWRQPAHEPVRLPGYDRDGGEKSTPKLHPAGDGLPDAWGLTAGQSSAVANVGTSFTHCSPAISSYTPDVAVSVLQLRRWGQVTVH